MVRRREFLAGVLASAALAALPRKVMSQSLQSERQFIFIDVQGGWDPLCAFAPMFGSPNIDMEPDARPHQVGRFTLVHHPERPAVTRFFETWGRETALINGLSTRSVAHEVCAMIAMTGDSSGSKPDWPTLIAKSSVVDYSLPSLVMGGGSFPGNYESLTARAGDAGQLSNLLTATMADESDCPVDLPVLGVQERLDRLVLRRSRRIGARETAELKLMHLEDMVVSTERAIQLKAMEGELPLSSDGFEAQMASAVTALSLGLSRCVTMTDGSEWDTHDDNQQQTPAFERLFIHLDQLLSTLSTTKGSSGRPLSETVTVVVLSEMGRTPKYNETGGVTTGPSLQLSLLVRAFRVVANTARIQIPLQAWPLTADQA